MSNRQNFPNSVFPLTGDVTSNTGNNTVTVEGIQTTPVSPQQPTNGQLLIFDQPTQQYVPGDPIVSGPDAVGTEPTVNPVQVAGIDEGNLVRELRTDAYGSFRAARTEEILEQILNTQRAILAALLSLDTSLHDQDFNPDSFSGVN